MVGIHRRYLAANPSIDTIGWERCCAPTSLQQQYIRGNANRRNSLNIRFAALTAALLFACTASASSAQPSAPSPKAPAVQAPSAPTPLAAPVDPLPRADPRYFTVRSPSVETVNSFLKQVWGFEPNRVYRVMAIVPTSAPGVTKITVFVTSKAPDAKIQSTDFFVMPDGKHAIAGGEIVSFGARPFADTDVLLRAKADGPSRGAADNALELVEFADLECPHCKEAQPIMDQIVKDFPKAHVVFQLFPLVDIHPSAFKAAAYGVCVQKQSNEAFFKYVSGVFDTQEGLTPATEDALLKAAAIRAGLDGPAIAACASTQATKDAVNADIKLAVDAGIHETPTLSVNGRLLPITTIPYDLLKKLIQYQATLDGVDSGATAETLAPTPVQPTLTTLPK
jgi:protein-disulfide isomerase